jgi:hypothetical protein
MSDKATCSRLPAGSPLGDEWESDFESDLDEEFEDLNPGKRTTQDKAIIRETIRQYQLVQASWISLAMKDCNVDRPIMDINDLLDEVTKDFEDARITKLEEARKYRPPTKKPTLGEIAKVSHVAKSVATQPAVIADSSPKKSFKDILQKPASKPGTNKILPSVSEFLEPHWTVVGKNNKPVTKTRSECRMDDCVQEESYCEETDSDRLSGLTEKEEEVTESEMAADSKIVVPTTPAKKTTVYEPGT